MSSEFVQPDWTMGPGADVPTVGEHGRRPAQPVLVPGEDVAGCASAWEEPAAAGLRAVAARLVTAWIVARGQHPSFAAPPERVRVSEFSLHTGRYQVLFDGSAAQAKELYLDAGGPVQVVFRRDPQAGLGMRGLRLPQRVSG